MKDYIKWVKNMMFSISGPQKHWATYHGNWNCAGGNSWLKTDGKWRFGG